MPALPANSNILVTGGNGYIGAWVIKVLLDRGFGVRAAVRSLAKAAPLEEVFATFVESGKLQFAVVPDILANGAYDDALVGVHGVIHLASPVASAEGGADPNTFLEPAEKGTLEILTGAMKASQNESSNLKRVVITSSVAAVYTPRPIGAGPQVFSEEDWNDEAVTEVREKGKDAQGMLVYRASKVLAERAAWEFYQKNKDVIPWDLVVLNPPFVFGPPIQNLKDVGDMGSTMKMWYDVVVAPGPKPREVLQSTQAWVDVRDLAEAHARAMEVDAAGGERVIISGGSYVFQEWLDIANGLPPSDYTKALPTGIPSITHTDSDYTVQYDTKKEQRLFGLYLKSKKETTKDILNWVSARGW